jgi:hypothetical protein
VSDDGQAKFSFACDLSDFSQLVVVAVDRDSVCQRSFDLKNRNMQVRDLRVTQVPDETKGLTQTRTTLNVLAKE